MDFTARQGLLLDDPESAGIAWQEVDCLLCGSSNWSPLVEAPDAALLAQGRWFMVVQCRDCGLCFTNPRPSEGTIDQFYQSDYPPHQARPNKERLRWWQRLPGLRSWQGPRRRLPPHGAGRLLDFGCGNGSFLVRMRHQGWNVVGLDASPDMVRRLQNELGIPGVVGSLPHPELPDEAFDLITMWQSLEHVHRPLETLRGAHRLLANGGQLLVATPNIDSLAFRWCGAAWNGLDLPRHLTHFSPWTLRLALHRAGFRSIRIRMLRRSGWLRDSAVLADRLGPKPPWRVRCLRFRAAASLVSMFAQLTRSADAMIATAVKH